MNAPSKLIHHLNLISQNLQIPMVHRTKECRENVNCDWWERASGRGPARLHRGKTRIDAYCAWLGLLTRKAMSLLVPVFWAESGLWHS